MLQMMLLLAALSLAPGDGAAGGPEAITRQAERLQRREPLWARGLFEQAARDGYAPAQASLGILLFKEGNRAGALRWLKSAADQNEPRALLIYGTAMFNGDGVAPNRVGGYAMVRRAAAQGSREALATQSEMELVIPQAEREAAARLAEDSAAPDENAEPAQTRTVAATGGKSRRAARPDRSRRPTASSLPQSLSGGAWRIQLGAFRQPGAGQALFARLAPRLPGKRPAFVPAGPLLRLQVGPYRSFADASAACRALGQPVCLPVRVR